MVLRGARELGGAGVDRLHAGAHAQAQPVGAHEALVEAGQVRQLGIACAHLLQQQHGGRVDIRERAAAHTLAHGHHVGDTREVPGVDAGKLVHALHGPAAAQRLRHVEDPALGRARHRGGELVLPQLLERPAAPGEQTLVAVLERAHGLAERLLEGAADCHDLAHGLHAGGERVIGALELLECKARRLDHAIVDRGLKAGRRGTGDVVDDLVQRVAHGQARGGLGDGEARGLGGERRRAAHARVHLDHDETPVLGVHRKLHVGAAGLNADLLQNGERRHAHALVLEVGERLRRGHGDGIAGVHAHRVQVLDGAYDDAVAGAVAHDLHLVLFPADNGLLHQHLVRGGKLQALRHRRAELGLIVRDAATGAAQGEARTQHHGVAQATGDLDRVLHRVRVARARHLEPQLGHGLVEELAVLAALDSSQVAADHLHIVALKRAVLGQLHRGVQAGLAAQRGQQGVWALPLDDLGDELRRDRLHIGAVHESRVSHDGGGVGVDEHDLVAVLLQHLAGLGAGIVELAGLADDDGAGPDDEDALDVGALRHERPPWWRSSSRPDGPG